MNRYQELNDKFGRLRYESKRIRKFIEQAVNYIADDAPSSLNKSRSILEIILKDVFDRERGEQPQKTDLNFLVGYIQSNKIAPRRISNRMRGIQFQGNTGTHHDVVESIDAEDTLRDLLVVFEWYLEKYNLQNFKADVSAPEIQVRYQKAINHSTKKKYKKALKVWNKLIAEYPNYTDAIIERGIVISALHQDKMIPEEQYRSTFEGISTILKTEPNNYKALCWLSVYYSNEENYEKGREYADKSLEIKSGYDRAQAAKGFVELKLKYYKIAIEHYDIAISLKPKEANYFNNRGVAKKGLGLNNGAIEDYNKAIEIDPKHEFSWRNRGNIKYDLEDYTDAISDYSFAIKNDPNDYFSIYRKGNCYAEKNLKTLALKEYDKALSIKKADFIYVSRGNCYRSLNKFGDSLNDYNQAIKIDEKYSAAWYNKGLSHYDLKEYGNSIEAFNTSLELNPEFYDAYYFIAESHLKLKQFELAVENSEKAIENDANKLKACSTKGLAFFKIERYYEAYLAFDQAIELGNDEPVAFFNRGKSFFEYLKTLSDIEERIPLMKTIKSFTDKMRKDITNFKFEELSDYSSLIERATKNLKELPPLNDDLLKMIKKSSSDMEHALKHKVNATESAEIIKQLEIFNQ